MSNDPMAEIRASFFVECEELLEALQDSLQTMEDGDEDPETINTVFRAVHSIKGGAGAFGLEGLVRFAHRYETVLDEVRSGRLEVTPDALKVFFQAADHLADLVFACRDDARLPEAETAQLLDALDGFLNESSQDPFPDTQEEEIDFEPAVLDVNFDLETESDADCETEDTSPLDIDTLPPPPEFSRTAGKADTYVVEFIPRGELFDTGNEPATLLRNLLELGDGEVTCDATDLPPLATLTPALPHLSWTVTLETDVDEAEINSVFEFVEGLCTLDIRRESQTCVQTEGPPSPPLDTEPEKEPSAQTLTAPQHALPDVPKVQGPAPVATNSPSKAPAPKSVVRVDLDRIERLVNLVGELVINQAMLAQSLEQSGLSPHSDAMNGLEEFQRLTRDIQDSVMMIRAQPVKSLFQRMSRIVREASAAVHKDVRLQTIGEATEVDKTVIERLADPLTHMIRNAVDHGLESSEERLKAGKDAQGKVTLSAAHRSGRVVIEVADDGGGINRAKVKQIAVDKGLIPPDAQLSDGEIDNLLFLPGFSTASVVSDLSGRGVGMDVVRTAIQGLGGRITISSEPGQGTTFSISLPLTLAVLDGMVIEVAQETLVLPLSIVVETLALTHDDVMPVRPGHHVIEVRSGFVPLFDLGAALGYRDPVSDFEGGVVLLITQDDERHAALLIDNILDQRQVVIKGLDDTFHRAPGIAAATILGDGQIALILDPSDLIATTLGVAAQAALPSSGERALA